MNGTDSTPWPQSDEALDEAPLAHEPYDRLASDEQGVGSGRPRLRDFSPAAVDRIRRFVAESVVKGGASPAAVADLYTAPEIVADEHATTYLDGRYVHGELPSDWRELQDDLAVLQREAPRGISAEDLLGRLDRGRRALQAQRSIFDDPDDFDEGLEDAANRILDRNPRLEDLTVEGRRSIERHIVAEVLNYGIAPIKTMELRDALVAAGDERSLQYLDLPFETGDRPDGWDELRDRALRLRAQMEHRGWDAAELHSQAESGHGGLDARELLAVLEERVDHGR